jgi:type IV pilus assembly protein PilM
MALPSFLTEPITLTRPGGGRSGSRRPGVSRPTLGGPTLTMPRIGGGPKPGGNVVGLEIEAGSIAAVEVAVKGGVPQVVNAGMQPISPEAFRDGEVVEPEAIAAALKALFDRQNMSPGVRLGVANQKLVVRTLRLPAIENPKELDAAVRFSAQEEIAMPLADAMIEHRVVGGAPGGPDAPPQIDVLVVAARREMILSALKPLRDAGLEPIGVDLSAFGMIRALATEGAPHEAGAERSAVLYCNLGDTMNLSVAAGRSCLFTRISPAGLEDISSSLVSSAGIGSEHVELWMNHVGLTLPVEQIEGDPAVVAATRECLERGAASLIDELRLSLDFYAAQEAAVPIERVVLCGPGSAIPGLGDEFADTVGLPVSVGVPAPLAGYDAASAARLTLPLGLALEA